MSTPSVSGTGSSNPVPAPQRTPMGDVLNTVGNMVYANSGQSIATMGVTVLGVGATLGKVSGSFAGSIALGVGISFLF